MAVLDVKVEDSDVIDFSSPVDTVDPHLEHLCVGALVAVGMSIEQSRTPVAQSVVSMGRVV